MNSIQIHGNLTTSLSLEKKGDVSYVRGCVASNRSPKNEKGDSKVDFFNFVLFGEIQDLDQYAMGVFVRLTGSIRLGEFDGKRTCEVVARKIERVARKSNDEAAA